VPHVTTPAGHRIHWTAEGTGPPVLLIMGLNGSSRAWYRLLPHLRDDHRLIVFDNRGTGGSDPCVRPLRMAELAADALAVLDAAGEASAHVIGTSMGGMVAQHIALEHRARVRSLCLMSTTPVGRHGGGPPWRMVAGAASRPVVGVARSGRFVTPILYARRTLTAGRERIREDMLRRLEETTPGRTAWCQLAAIARHDTRARLAELAGLTVTVVHGDEDVLVPTDRGRLLAALVPGAEFVLLEGCGHLTSTDDEAATAAAVRGHLAAAGAVVSVRPAASPVPPARRAA